jgi:hypothetical protein
LTVTPKTTLHFLRFIQLGLLFLFTQTLSSVAQSSDTKDAEFIGRAIAANGRCNVLTPQEATELSAYASGVASKPGQAAIDKGKSIGDSVACDSTTARGIRGVLASARRKNLPKSEASKLVAENQPPLVEKSTNTQSNDGLGEATPVVATQNSEPEPVTEVSEAPPPPAIAAPPPKPDRQTVKLRTAKPKLKQSANDKRRAQATGSLKRYEVQAAAYFKALRCRTNSGQSIGSFYSNVIGNHRRLVAVYGRGRVAAVVRRAETRAKATRC